MKGRSILIAVGIFIGICIAGLGAGWYYTNSQSFMQTAGAAAAEKAQAMLGTRIEVGRIRVDSLHSLTAEDITVYDKQDQEIAQADSARVEFSLFSLFKKSPAEAVNTVTIRMATAQLVRREDGSWNYEDLTQNQGESGNFTGKVVIEDGMLTGRMDGQELALGNLQGTLDFADNPSVGVKASFTNHAAEVSLSGHLGGERQTLSVEGNDFVLSDYLGFLPEGTLPENVKLEDAAIHKLKLAAVRQGDDVTLNGQTEFSDGRVNVLGTEVRDIAGMVNFSDKNAMLFVHGEAEGQQAAVHGKVRWDTGAPYLNLVVESQGFDPGEILKSSPYHGAAAFTATVHGTIQNPKLEGSFRAPLGSLYGYSFQNAEAEVRYEDERISVKSLKADIFGGKLQGEGEFYTQDTVYNAHLKADALDGAALADILPGVSGKFTADVGLHGAGKDVDALSIYGTAAANQILYRGISVDKADASFFKQGPELRFDALNLQLADGSQLGMEGSIMDGHKLDLSFHGAQMDLALARQFVPEADMSGKIDFTGSVHGDSENPTIEAKFAAIDGKLFKQPFHSLRGSASGSLDGVNIDSFSMENGGNETWLVKGVVGFTGQRRLDLQVDTVGARMEDVAALVAPDQPITGNIDNTIHFTGTLDDPQAVGYIHFYYGSYGGLILSGMDGDYTLHDGILNVQDFHIYSPLVDMDLNGTIDREKNLDLHVAAHDIQLDRIGSRMPYPVSGHARFDGHIGGNFGDPVFNGTLDSASMIFNGQTITNAAGSVIYQGHIVRLDDFSFSQNEGRYTMSVLANTDTKALSGRLDVANGDVNALMAMFNLKNDVLTGRIDGTIDLGGTVDNPDAHLQANITGGQVKGYEVHDVGLDLTLQDHVLNINKLSGSQGTGIFAAQGTVDLNGPIDAKLSAKDIQAGVLVKSAGINADAKGLVNLEAQFNGTIDNPGADVSLNVIGGGAGNATFDTLTGLLNLHNGIINVNQFIVQKQIKKQKYRASASGSIPLKALTAAADADLDNYEQFNLDVSLDDADLSLLPIFSRQVDWAVGETNGSVKVTGTLAHPLLNGMLELPEGAMKLKALKTPVTRMKGVVRFAGDQVSIEECSGHLGDGKYNLTGSSHFSGGKFSHYVFDLQADKLEINSPFYRGPLTGELHLNEGEIFHHIMPRLSGKVFVDDTTISIPAIPDSDGELPRMLLDLDLQLGKKVHFFSPSLYNMRLAGSAHFGGTTHHPQTSGTISVLRGTVTYNQAIFKIREGEAYFNQVDSFLPSILLRADTKMAQTKVYLAIDGPANQMNIHLTSSPEMSETEILKLLTFRTAGNGQNADMDVSSLVNFGLQMSFLGELENNMRNVLNLDEFTIAGESVSASGSKKNNADNNTREVYNVEMGKYINDKIMLKYKQGIGSSDYSYGIQYDLNDRMSLTANRDQDSKYTYGIEARFKF